jgi:hypothetical protein
VAVNTVEILVSSRDDARPDLDDLRAKLAELGAAVDTARVEVDDTAAAAKLDDLKAKLLRLNDQVANPKIKMAGAVRAESQVHLIEGALDDLGRKSDETSSRTGRLAGVFRSISAAIMGGSGGGGGGEGAEEGAEGGSGGLAGALDGLPLLLNPVVLAAGALAAILAGPLIAGLFAVTASIGSLAVFAIPALSQIWGAMTGGKKAMDSLHGPMRQVAEEGKGLMGTFDKISKAVQPSVMQMFGDGLKIVQALMPSLKPLAEGAAKAFGQFFNRIATWLNGPSGQKFLHWLDTDGPRAMQDFTHALWDLMSAAGRTFDFLKNAGDEWYKHWDQLLVDLHGAFDVSRHAIADWAHNTAAHFDEVRRDIAGWAHNTASNFDDTRHNIATWAHDTANDFDTVRHNIASWAHDLASYFDEARANIHNWADDAGRDVTDVVNWFRALPGRILGALGDLASMLYHAGVNAIEGLLRGMGSMVSGAISTVSGWGHDIANAIGGAFGIHFSEPSEATKMIAAGERAGQGFAKGLLSTRSLLAAAAAQVSHAGMPGTGYGGYGGYGAAGAGGRLEVVLRLEGGGSELTNVIAKNLKGWVRINGGGATNSVQRALGPTA